MLASAGLLLAPPGALAGQMLLSGTFAQATTNAQVTTLNTGPVPLLPCLTAGTTANGTGVSGCNLPAPDAPGAGVLRLTDAIGISGGEFGGIVYKGSSGISI